MIGEESVVLKAIHSVEGSSGGGIDWGQRCVHLELSLQHLRSQSNKVRHVLLEKIVRLEYSLQEAEAKAAKSESQLELLRTQAMDRLTPTQARGDSGDRSGCSSPEFVHLQQVVEEKEKVINLLEHQVEEQKKLRLQDAKQVEAKAAKIKEWVAHKLKELEDQNEVLREENRRYNDQLKTLQTRLEGASPETRKRIESAISNLKEGANERKVMGGISRTESSRCPDAAYAVVDPRRKARLGNMVGLRSPKCRYGVGRKEFVACSSSSDEETPPGDKCFKSRVNAAVSPSSKPRKPIPPPRTRHMHSTATYANIPGTPNLSKRCDALEIKTLLSRGGSLDRKLADMRKLNFSEIREKRKQALAAAADELHDYSEIYTPSREYKGFDYKEPRPPTPPLHRCPSWESRIYKIASTSINSATTTPTHSIRSNYKKQPALNLLNNPTIEKETFYELNVPVFATVQGRASQIRSIPFSGDSSDSSDNETDGRVTTTGTTSSTSGEGSDLFATPMRRVRRGISVESALSDDYDVPPDALASTASHDALCSIDSSFEPKAPKRFSSLQREPMSPFKSIEPLEKSGYLTKLGGKLKTWRRRWFVLKDGVLSHYKSQSDTLRCKPRGQIKLDDNCRINRTEGSGTFQITTGNNKNIYYLTADSVVTMETWVKMLQNVLKRNATGFVFNEDCKPTIEGWVTRVKHGQAKKCWCSLIGRTFVYFKNPNDMNPLGYVNMRQAKVEEVSHLSDSDNEDNEPRNLCSATSSEGIATSSEYTIVIHQNQLDTNPVYLLLATKQEMDSWLYHLTVVSCSDNITGTPFEHIISKLMQSDSPENEPGTIDGCQLWSEPLLIHTKDNITQPLTTLPSELIRREALKLFKSLQLFVSVPLDSAGIDYHVSLIQNSLQLCLTHPELQNELFCQLIKQTSAPVAAKLCGAGSVHHFLLCATQSLFTCDSSGTGSEKTSPTSNGNAPETSLSPISLRGSDKNNPPNHVLIQGFQFLALAIPLFLPKSRTLWLLKHHLRRSADTKTEIGKYAVYCQRALDKSLAYGHRDYRPSRMEVLGILLRNPYQHSLPHSIPVHFLNETYMVVGFDGSTTIEQFVALLNSQSGIRSWTQSGFALFSDDPIDKSADHLLRGDLKLADVISRWELALREKHLGRFENTRVVKLTYKNRLYYRQHLNRETDKEKLLLTYQISQEIMKGQFPVTQELALELSALLAQTEFGDVSNRNIGDDIVQKVIERFYPLHLSLQMPSNGLIQEIRRKWKELEGCSSLDCSRIYLNCARKWAFCGAKLFEAKPLKPIKGDAGGIKATVVPVNTKVWIAVNDESISVLDLDTMHAVVQYSFRSIMTFGGCREDFMLVVNTRLVSEGDSGSASGGSAGGGGSSQSGGSFRSEKLLFSMTKLKILEITLLVADYINAQNTVNATLFASDSKLPFEVRDYSVDRFATNSSKISRAVSVRTTGTPGSLTRSQTKL